MPGASARLSSYSPLRGEYAGRGRMKTIVLSREDMLWGKRVGIDRSHKSKNRKPSFAYEPGFGPNTQHILGARGELAFCRLMGLEWPARVNTFRDKPDVDPDWEVRTSPIASVVKVDVRDPEGYRVVQVVSDHGSDAFTITGFILVRTALQMDRFLDDPGNRGKAAYFIPRNLLVPIEEVLG